LVYYRPVTLDDYEQVRELFAAVGWEGRTAEESRLRRMIANADRTVGAWDDESNRLVGFARALCDEAFDGYIGDVCVHPDCRHKGIGTELVTQIIEDSPEITWAVLAENNTPGFWERQGFNRSDSALEKHRSR
jgi:ribosomal protein S18 acetylase RimI-like enzyme